jgi:hypothetical protein
MGTMRILKIMVMISLFTPPHLFQQYFIIEVGEAKSNDYIHCLISVAYTRGICLVQLDDRTNLIFFFKTLIRPRGKWWLCRLWNIVLYTIGTALLSITGKMFRSYCVIIIYFFVGTRRINGMRWNFLCHLIHSSDGDYIRNKNVIRKRALVPNLCGSNPSTVVQRSAQKLTLNFTWATWNLA